MKFSRDLKIKSVVIKLGQLDILVDKLIEWTKDDWVSLEWQRPKFELENFQGETFSFDNKSEFVNCIKVNFKNTKELQLSYYGENVGFRLRFDNSGFLTSLYVSVEANDRSKMLLIKDEIEKSLSIQSWNFLADKLIPLALIAFFIGTVIILKEKFRLIDKNILTLIFYVILGVAFWLNFKLPRYYPALVIECSEGKSGRVFKKDLWLVVILVILPFFINALNNFLWP